MALLMKKQVLAVPPPEGKLCGRQGVLLLS